MDNETQVSKRNWYDNKAIVIIFLILFFPIGLFALWKNQEFSKNTKIIVSSILAVFVILGLISEEPTSVTDQARPYQVVKKDDFSFPGRTRINFNILSPQSATFTEYTHTSIKAALEKQKETGADVVSITIEPSVRMQDWGNAYAITFYSPDGGGLSGDQNWTWDIKATDKPLTQHEIDICEAWIEHRDKFQVDGLTDESRLVEFLANKFNLLEEEIHLPLTSREKYVPE